MASSSSSSLLLGLLAPVRLTVATSVPAPIDGRAIAEVAWADFLAEFPQLSDDPSWTAPRVIALLEEAVGRPVESEAPEIDGDVVDALASWLEAFIQCLQEIDPLAVEIIALRSEGFNNRAISEGLDTGLRLINRIVEDIRVPPATSKPQEETVPC
jgi:hypothetical protein